MVQLVIAEKPSVARDLARVLGVRPTGKHCFDGKDRVITWCVGHLVELDEPASYDGRWKAWRLDTLPMIPSEFKLRPVPSTREQLRRCADSSGDKRFSEVVNACDAGREGELIFRYVYQLAGSRLPIRRLWISSLTDEAIRQGFSTLKPGAELEKLADAARCRSEADWLVGLNATRAVTVRQRTGPGFHAVFHRSRADAHAGHSGGTRKGHPELRAAGLLATQGRSDHGRRCALRRDLVAGQGHPFRQCDRGHRGPRSLSRARRGQSIPKGRWWRA
jgi:hypothetical protein